MLLLPTYDTWWRCWHSRAQTTPRQDRSCQLPFPHGIGYLTLRRSVTMAQRDQRRGAEMGEKKGENQRPRVPLPLVVISPAWGNLMPAEAQTPGPAGTFAVLVQGLPGPLLSPPPPPSSPLGCLTNTSGPSPPTLASYVSLELCPSSLPWVKENPFKSQGTDESREPALPECNQLISD